MQSANGLTRRQFFHGAATAAAATLLAACQPAPTPTTAPAATAKPADSKAPATSAPAATEAPSAGACGVTPPGTFPVVKDKVTLTVFALQDPLVENMETNLLTVEYEERTNVHINWQLAPAQGLDEKRNLLFASGNYPDIMMAVSIPRQDQVQYGSQGVLIPLNDLIEQHTVHVRQVLLDIPLLKDAITAPDGNIYALGTDQQCFHCSFSQRMWINWKWLEKLNLKMPTTTDEFYEVLKAFREKDPNGNVKADEIPLMGLSWGQGHVSGFLMNAFIYNDSESRFILTDGKIDVAFNKPEWLEGLKYLNRLYADKLIDPSALTIADADLRRLGENEDAQILGAVAAFYPGTFQSMAGERHLDYDPVPPLKGPEGVQLCGWYPFTAGVGRFAVTKACKCPEVAVRWVDWFYSTEGGLRSRIGREGFEWRKAKEDEIGLNGQPAKWIKLTPINEVQNYFWGQGAWPQQFIHSEQASCMDPRACLERRLYDAAKLYEPYKPKEVVPPLWIPNADVARLAQLQAEINAYVNQAIAQFIAGDRNLNDWDNYCKELDKIGLAEYLAINQRAYDAKHK